MRKKQCDDGIVVLIESLFVMEQYRRSFPRYNTLSPPFSGGANTTQTRPLRQEGLIKHQLFIAHGLSLSSILPGAAIVNTVGPIRQIVQNQDNVPRRYLVIVPGTITQPGAPVQIQQQ